MVSEIITKADKIYRENFPMETWFERAIFFSWYCAIRNCKFCYMSTQPNKKDPVKARRKESSLLAELILCKKLGWRLGFISGGLGAFKTIEFEKILKNMYNITNEKMWLNIGAVDEEKIKRFLPYTKGIVGSIETINKKIHDFVCPSKPIEKYEKMFKTAEKYGLKKAMTIIIGLGETLKDYPKLKKFIEKYNIEKIHFYGLNPQKGTYFENANPPSLEYQAEWIAKTRIDFPKIDIQCGIWRDRTDYIPLLLKAGANSISKYPITRYFASKSAQEIEDYSKKAGRTFKGTLTKIPENIDWDKEVDNLKLDKEMKEKVRKKLKQYLKKMRKNIKNKDF